MNYVIVNTTRKEYRLKLRAAYMDELENRIGGAITDKLSEMNKLGLCIDIIAAAIDPIDIKTSKAQAAQMYEDLVDEGKNLRDYQMIVLDLMVAAGFMSAAAVEAQKKAAEIQTKIAERVANAEAEKIEAKLAKIEAKKTAEKSEVAES